MQPYLAELLEGRLLIPRCNNVGYIPLSEEAYNIALVKFHKGQVGTVFDGVPQPNLTLGEVLRRTRRVK